MVQKAKSEDDHLRPGEAKVKAKAKEGACLQDQTKAASFAGLRTTGRANALRLGNIRHRIGLGRIRRQIQLHRLREKQNSHVTITVPGRAQR